MSKAQGKFDFSVHHSFKMSGSFINQDVTFMPCKYKPSGRQNTRCSVLRMAWATQGL